MVYVHTNNGRVLEDYKINYNSIINNKKRINTSQEYTCILCPIYLNQYCVSRTKAISIIWAVVSLRHLVSFHQIHIRHRFAPPSNASMNGCCMIRPCHSDHEPYHCDVVIYIRKAHTYLSVRLSVCPERSQYTEQCRCIG